MVTVAGMKQSGSHPGVEEPIAFSTVAFIECSANAPGAAVIPIETIAKRTTNDEIINWDFVDHHRESIEIKMIQNTVVSASYLRLA